MNQDQEDKAFDKLVRRALVPKGFRPQTDGEIDTMLDALGETALPKEKLNRMLAKVRGDAPMGGDEDQQVDEQIAGESKEAAEFAEMYRAKGKSSAEVNHKLTEMERRASKPFGEPE